MAYALPAAIGAQRAWPERSVIAIAGDGGLGMLLSEFLTAVKYELPITVVVFDNGQLGLIEVEQAVAGFPASETGLPSFDFAAYARLCGGEGTRVTEPELLDRALSTAFASRRPWIVDVRIDPDELLFPPRLDPSEALGFGLSKLRSFFAALSE
jgi:thiamine pyrophosphate-dependent acetolactate synthase large subunit-like protein